MSLSTSDKLKVEIVGHTAKITIDNPGANTWDTESLPALRDPQCRSIPQQTARPRSSSILINSAGSS